MLKSELSAQIWKSEYLEQMVESGQQREMFPYQMGNIVDSRISINAPFLHSFLRRPTEA